MLPRVKIARLLHDCITRENPIGYDEGKESSVVAYHSIIILWFPYTFPISLSVYRAPFPVVIQRLISRHWHASYDIEHDFTSYRSRVNRSALNTRRTKVVKIEKSKNSDRPQ